MKRTTVALVEDQALFRTAIKALINQYPDYQVIAEAEHGKAFISRLDKFTVPDIVLLDLHMPVMDGFETARWLKENYPRIKILVLSMNNQPETIVRAMKLGARGFLRKEGDPTDLKTALDNIRDKGYFLTESVADRLVNSLGSVVEDTAIATPPSPVALLSEREIEFLRLVCSEMTYKEIANELNLSARTIDGYRDALFEKLQIKSRVGLVVFAIKYGIFQLRP